MLIGVNPAQTQWLSWSEIQRERIRLDRAIVSRKRTEMAGRLVAAKFTGDMAAALQSFDDLLARLDGELSDLSDRSDASDGSEPAFEIGHLKWSVRGKARALYGSGKPEDATAAIELVVRNGCRGHRNLKDSQAEVPVAMETKPGDKWPVLSAETFEVYAASGVAEALASVILDYNTYAQDRAKN